jgi:hypothetical protein
VDQVHGFGAERGGQDPVEGGRAASSLQVPQDDDSRLPRSAFDLVAQDEADAAS